MIRWVLVVPYWNVNIVDGKGYKRINLVLVVPYWNVNDEDLSTGNYIADCFSSTILECKYIYTALEEDILSLF